MSDKHAPSAPPDYEAGHVNGFPAEKKGSKMSAAFGGPDTYVGARIVGLPDYLKDDASFEGENTAEAILEAQKTAEDGQSIQYRTCSWQKTAALLFSEYICIAIMSFPASYAALGLVPGIILTIVVAATVLYTSLILWEFCLRHPEVRDVCDIGQTLFWGKKWAWWGTAVMFLLNNTFIQGLHVLVGAEYINTMTEGDDIGGCRTIEFGIVVMIICWIFSLPRTFSMLAKLGIASALFTFISVVMAAAMAGSQGQPAGYSPEKGEPIVRIVASADTGFVAGLSAFLNISYTFIGQITLPSFIAEMKDPKEFPKSLWACTIAEMIVFSVVGGVIYANAGEQYTTSPAFGSLDPLYKKISFSFMIPTLIFLGCLYASVTGRFIFFRLFRNSRHLNSHTIVGWTSWAGILLGLWILAFIIANVIPFFGSLLSVMSSLFDCWFGFIFWGVAYFRMRTADIEAGRKRSGLGDLLTRGVNVILIITGIFFLTAGTYASVQGIIDNYAAGKVRGVFSCASNAI